MGVPLGRERSFGGEGGINGKGEEQSVKDTRNKPSRTLYKCTCKSFGEDPKAWAFKRANDGEEHYTTQQLV